MKSIHKSYKFRIYPNEQQISLLSKCFGVCRFVFNYYLNKRKESDIKQKKGKALPIGELTIPYVSLLKETDSSHITI